MVPNQNQRRTPAAVAPPETNPVAVAVIHDTPAAPALCKVANKLPAATFPIVAWVAAAAEPAATPLRRQTVKKVRSAYNTNIATPLTKM